VLTARSAVEETKTYAIHNVDAKAKTLIIEHAERYGYKLLNQKPTETTASAYRFEVKLAPSGTETFPVREERLIDQTYQLTSMTPDVLSTWVQNKTLTDAQRRELEQIAQKKREIAQNDEAVKSADSDIADLTQDQARVRSNIQSLNNVSGQQELVQQYARQLATAETRLAALRDTQTQLRRTRATLESDLNTLMERIDF
jgi:DNA repair exonuclease SbcCD ATPase subunit